MIAGMNPRQSRAAAISSTPAMPSPQPPSITHLRRTRSASNPPGKKAATSASPASESTPPICTGLAPSC